MHNLLLFMIDFTMHANAVNLRTVGNASTFLAYDEALQCGYTSDAYLRELATTQLVEGLEKSSSILPSLPLLTLSRVRQ
jgi:hypothetical protein